MAQLAVAVQFRDPPSGRFVAESEVKASPERDVTFTLKQRKRSVRKP